MGPLGLFEACVISEPMEASRGLCSLGQLGSDPQPQPHPSGALKVLLGIAEETGRMCEYFWGVLPLSSWGFFELWSGASSARIQVLGHSMDREACDRLQET